MPSFDIESICVDEEDLKDTKTTTWFGKQTPISISISSNLMQEPNCFSVLYTHDSVSSFLDASEILATQSTAQYKMKFSRIETAQKRPARIREIPNPRSRHCAGIKAEDDISKNSSIRFP